jgi:hypothetical protein
MPPTIVSPADCEVRAVIRFLSAKGVKLIDIHREICEIYGQNIMSDMGGLRHTRIKTTIHGMATFIITQKSEV